MNNNDLYFEYIEDFADYIVERIEDDVELFLTVVGRFEEIKNIIKEIFCVTEVDFEHICLSSFDASGYEDEYVLDFWCDDGVVQISCEPAKRDGKYLNLAGDETYLLENCSSKIIPLCEGSELYFVNIDDECDCDDECCGCCECDCCKGNVLVECSTDENGDTHGFTASKSDDNGCYSFSYYANNKLTEEDIYSILEEYGF